MRNFNLLFVAIALITTWGCKKIDKFTQFELEFTESFTIPSSTGVSFPFNVISPDVETNSTTEFEVNDTRKDLIEEIKLTQLDLALKSPSNSDFSFLKSAEIYIAADGLSEVKVAYIDNVPDNVGKSISMTTTNADLQEYIKKDKFDLNLKVVTDKVITSDHEIETYSVFFVDAKILGQ